MYKTVKLYMGIDKIEPITIIAMPATTFSLFIISTRIDFDN